MAFFKLRKAAAEQSAPAPAPESVDALRRRARYRLAGAALLVLAGVIGFPLLFDNQPRPIAVDIPIDIPDKTKVRPLDSGPLAEVRPAQSAPKAASDSGTAQAPQAGASRSDSGTLVSVGKEAQPLAKEPQKEEVILSTAKPATTVAKPEDKPAAKTDSKLATKLEPKPDSKPDPKPEAKAKASDKPADKPTDKTAASDKAAAGGRFVVQFGAFTDSARAHEARVKVEKTGLKTYAQVADTPDGKKFRVRVGPFEKRTDAEKAAEKIKKLDLPAAILAL